MHRQKKIGIFFLCLFMNLCFLFPMRGQAAEIYFKDVDPKSWSWPYIQESVAQGLMKGTSADTFSPSQPMSRAMVAVVLYRMSGSPQMDASMENPYPDVSSGQWYEREAAWAFHNGLITGHGDGTFQGDSPVTREQIALMAQRYRASLENTIIHQDLSGYTDSKSISPYAYRAMEWAVSKRILNGSAGKLNPQDTATREECAKIFTLAKKGQGDMSIPIPLGEEYRLELYDARSTVASLEEEIRELEPNWKKARENLESVEKEIESGSAGFFASRMDTSSDAARAYAIVTDTDGMTQDDPSVPVYKKTRLGADDDATGLDNMIKALEVMKTYYDIRRAEGLSIPNVSDILMAIAQKQANYSYDTMWHSYAYNVGENLALGDDPFGFWYDEEKALYLGGERDSHAVGHYLNIISSQYTEIGCSWQVRDGAAWTSQTFSYRYMIPSANTYSYEEYLSMARSYRDGLKTRETQARNEEERARKALDSKGILEKELEEARMKLQEIENRKSA